MINEAIVLTILFTTCVSYVRAFKNKTDYNTTEKPDNNLTNFTNVTGISLNESLSLTTTTPQDVKILETFGHNNTDTYNSTFLDYDTNKKAKTANDLMNEFYDLVKEPYQSGNISDNNNNGTYFEKENSNITDNNDKGIPLNHIAITQTTLTIQTANVSKKRKNHSQYTTEIEGPGRLLIEDKKVMLRHHLHLVPMEDKPLDSMMVKSQRYLICVFVPIGVGMIGAIMIVCTVVILRGIAMKHPTHYPLHDDVEEETSITSRVSSVR